MDALPDGEALVVERRNGLTTFQFPISSFAAHRAMSGDLSAVPGTEQDVALDSLWVLDAQDLMQKVAVPDRGTIRFFDWGSVPEVEAPPAEQIEDVMEYFICNGPAVDAGR